MVRKLLCFCLSVSKRVIANNGTMTVRRNVVASPVASYIAACAWIDVGKSIKTQQELKAFVQENGENRRLCSKKLATVWTAHTKQPISAVTIRRNLKKVGLTSCIPRKKPAMTEVHHQARLKWAYAHKNW
ncbi:16416_t:CDS:2 [Funneliformis caledonium]|uniref:16416_t:CDS:1 n=1 Tax=Funneliformis caledonium TaxID=1117310 RepID=A0A9N8Z5B8_9GLOM|nr:16416_t:CDS:2 [Funneliformis caledonium]